MPEHRIGIDAAVEWPGKTLVFVGRLDRLPRRIAARHLQSRGARVRQGLTRATDIVVIGHAARALLGSGRLQPLLKRAHGIGARCISEIAFLRALGLAPPLHQGQRSLCLDEVSRLSGLDPAIVRMLALFDVIETDEGLRGFRDLITARTAARLLTEKLALSDVIGSILRVRERLSPSGNRITSLVRSGSRGVALQIDGALAELDGQLRLPLLPGVGNPSIEDLFEAAQRAEDVGTLAEAERLYRRCCDLDRTDPAPAFNLANVLGRLDRGREAKLYLRVAIAIDPAFAEAWYNLAHLAEAGGDLAAARAHLERALDADPNYADAVYNLAHLCWRAGDYGKAARLWKRYLSLDAHSEWTRKARHGLALCRMQLNAKGGDGRFTSESVGAMEPHEQRE